MRPPMIEQAATGAAAMKRLIRRIIGGVLAGLLLLAIVAGIVLFSISRRGSGRIEQWIGSQIVGIAGGYLNPRLHFEDLDYEYPDTVRLRNLRLTAADPQSPGGEVDILAAGRVTIVLAEVPRVGEPIVVQSIIAERPLFQIVKAESAKGRFAGFSNLLKSESFGPPPQQAQTAPQAEAAGNAEGPVADTAAPPAETSSAGPAAGQVAARPKLSDVFQMRLIELRDARIVYDPRIEGTAAMELDQINMRLDFKADDRGWYAVETSLAREPIFEAQIAGKLNLDNLQAEEIDLKLLSQLADDQISYLPPELQKLIEQYGIRGRLEATITGQMPLTRPLAGALKGELHLSDGHFVAGGYEVPVESIDVAASMAEGRAFLEQMKMLALTGEAVASGSITFADENLPTDFSVTAKNLVLAGVQREGATQPVDEQKLRGRVHGELEASVPLASLLAALKADAPSDSPAEAETAAEHVPLPLPRSWGHGQVRIDRARLVRLPVISALMDAIKAELVSGKAHDDERASADFTFDGDLVRLEKLTYVGSALAARGEGVVTLDGRLDLEVNAGPVEKMQSLLGPELGKALGSVTDRLVLYEVTGTTRQPEVRLIVVRGLDRVPGVEQTREGIGDAGRAVGRGISRVGGGLRGALDGDRNRAEEPPASRPTTRPGDR